MHLQDEEDSDGDIPVLGLTGTGYWDFTIWWNIQLINLLIVTKAMYLHIILQRMELYLMVE